MGFAAPPLPPTFAAPQPTRPMLPPPRPGMPTVAGAPPGVPGFPPMNPTLTRPGMPPTVGAPPPGGPITAPPLQSPPTFGMPTPQAPAPAHPAVPERNIAAVKAKKRAMAGTDGAGAPAAPQQMSGGPAERPRKFMGGGSMGAGEPSDRAAMQRKAMRMQNG